jgi:hypothetical protein
MEKSYQQFKDKAVETLAVNIGESDFLVNKFVELEKGHTLQNDPFSI